VKMRPGDVARDVARYVSTEQSSIAIQGSIFSPGAFSVYSLVSKSSTQWRYGQ